MASWYLGIDPGQSGGLGIVGNHGEFIAAHRWNKSEPRRLYELLYLIKDLVIMAYLENINLPQVGAAGIENKFSAGGNLLVNSGIWQGWLMALEIPAILIPPATWQAAHKLYHWQAKRKDDPGAMTPIKKARSNWPAAPLEFNADDGKAVGLLLAALALKDKIDGIDRGAIQDRAREKAKLKRKVQHAKKTQNPRTDRF